MKSHLWMTGLLVGVIAGFAGCAGAPANEDQGDLVRKAETWLRLMDEERYDQAWAQTTARFKGEKPLQEFIGASLSFRRPLGEGVKREAWDQEFLISAPGRPDGTYFSVSFRTSFHQRKANSFEYLLLEPEGGAWKVTSYCLDDRSVHEACPPSARWWTGSKRPATLFQGGNK